MSKLVECVPNFSEGRDAAVIRSITAEIEAVRGVTLLDVDPGEDTNRTVVTFVGSPEAVVEAAFRAGKRAAETIDMTRHHGSHARMGAMDVCPFVPVAGVTMADCVALARDCGRRIGELGIPVYLYEHAASQSGPQESRRRAGRRVRGAGTTSWRIRTGSPISARPGTIRVTGAYIVGAREFLIAYNVNLATTDKRYADDIAYNLRERGRHKRSGNVAPFYYKGDVGGVRRRTVSPAAPAITSRGHGTRLRRTTTRRTAGTSRRATPRSATRPERSRARPVYADGRFPHVKAVGWVVDKYRRAQISINLTRLQGDAGPCGPGGRA